MILSLLLEEGVYILFLILSIVIAPILIYLLYRSVRRERHRFFESKICSDEFSAEEMDELINRRIRTATKRTNFMLIKAMINDAKSIKTTFGDVSWNFYKKTLMSRIEKASFKSCKVCNYSTDTILVLVDDVEQTNELNEWANLLLLESRKPVDVGNSLKIESDINVAVAAYNEFNNSFSALMQSLDIAASISKRRGVNTFAIYADYMNNMETEEYKNYQEIKQAIDANEFMLHYQPMYDFTTKEIVGFETLLRWQHKTLGVLAPNKFLSILEQSGDINWVGLWAFGEVITQGLAWKLRSPEKTLTLHFNISRRQLMSETLIDDLRRIMRRHKLEPSSICFEIIENTFFEKVDMIKQNIEKLSQCGFRVGIDNYGVELNTLSLIDKFKVDFIKLDREFVKEVRDNNISEGILKILLDVASKNSIKIIAEGVEDRETVEYLQDKGINLGQGYYFSKPMEAKEFPV